MPYPANKFNKLQEYVGLISVAHQAIFTPLPVCHQT